MLQAPQEDRSISERHELLILKHDLHWQWFNILTFGVVEGGASITEAIAKVYTSDVWNPIWKPLQTRRFQKCDTLLDNI